MRKLGWSVFLPCTFVLSFTILFSTTATVTAQTAVDSHYVVSAKAGRLNHIAGQVQVKRQGAAEWQPLLQREPLATGATAQTGVNGRLEMLLNPGSYLRVGSDSEFELTNADLGDLQIKLLKGALIIEATGTDGTRLLASITTPQTGVTIDRNGLYRINANAPNTTEVLVSKGRAMVNRDGVLTKVESGKKLVVDGSANNIVKFDRKLQDGFDQWSKQRAETLVAANRRLSNALIASAFTTYRRNGAQGYGYAPYFGLWMYDSSLSGYTFLPFYNRWSSPYGIGYDRCFGFSYRGNQPLHVGWQSAGGGTTGQFPAPSAVSNMPPQPARAIPNDSERMIQRPMIDRGHHKERPEMPEMPVDSADRFDRDLGGRYGNGKADRHSVDTFDRGHRNSSDSTYQPPVNNSPVHRESAPTYSPPAQPAPVDNTPVERPSVEHHKASPEVP